MIVILWITRTLNAIAQSTVYMDGKCLKVLERFKGKVFKRKSFSYISYPSRN